MNEFERDETRTKTSNKRLKTKLPKRFKRKQPLKRTNDFLGILFKLSQFIILLDKTFFNE